MKTELFSLGSLYVSDFLKQDEQPSAKNELKLQLDSATGLVSLSSVADNSLCTESTGIGLVLMLV